MGLMRRNRRSSSSLSQHWRTMAGSERFKKIEGTRFFEFKNHQIRMPCFFEPGGSVIITHGFKKKGDRIPQPQLERAERIREEDLAVQKSRTGKKR